MSATECADPPDVEAWELFGHAFGPTLEWRRNPAAKVPDQKPDVLEPGYYPF